MLIALSLAFAGEIPDTTESVRAAELRAYRMRVIQKDGRKKKARGIALIATGAVLTTAGAAVSTGGLWLGMAGCDWAGNCGGKPYVGDASFYSGIAIGGVGSGLFFLGVTETVRGNQRLADPRPERWMRLQPVIGRENGVVLNGRF